MKTNKEIFKNLREDKQKSLKLEILKLDDDEKNEEDINLKIEDKNKIIIDATNQLISNIKIVDTHAELFKKCKKYVQKWERGKQSRHARLSISDIYVGVNLDLDLANQDTQDDIDLFIKEISTNESLTSIDILKSDNDKKWDKYSFSNENNAQLHLIFYYNNFYDDYNNFYDERS